VNYHYRSFPFPCFLVDQINDAFKNGNDNDKNDRESIANRSLFKMKWGFEMPNHQDEVIFYCKMGGRAMIAATILKLLGYKY
jgi:rhodanese-related sulfurtransferase